MAAAHDLVRAVGDRQIPIRGVFKRRVNGHTEPLDLTDATITFRMVAETTSATVVVNWAASFIEDVAAGLVYYQPTASDVAAAGLYRAWFRSTKAGNLPLTLPPEGFLIELTPIP